jgi:hypothetical protein
MREINRIIYELLHGQRLIHLTYHALTTMFCFKAMKLFSNDNRCDVPTF